MQKNRDFFSIVHENINGCPAPERILIGFKFLLLLLFFDLDIHIFLPFLPHRAYVPARPHQLLPAAAQGLRLPYQPRFLVLFLKKRHTQYF